MAVFLIFFIFALLIPGLVLTNKLTEKSNFIEKIFLGTVVGIVSLTLVFYAVSLLNIRFLIFAYILVCLFYFLKQKLLPSLKINFFLDKIALLIITAGTIFQSIPTFRSGLNLTYGFSFWGPNTHDGMWHISLINEIIQGFPIENPIFAGTILRNYHFFYDLMVAGTAYLTKIPLMDLIFRFYPIIFAFLLGLGTYCLASGLFKKRIAAYFSLYFVYFAGSFGWIVDYLKNKTLGGESAFWANQSISFNLNPPFAVSLLIIIAFILSLISLEKIKSKMGIFISVLLLGSLVGFKSYGSVLVLGALGLVAFINLFRRQFEYLYIFILAIFFTLLIFITNFDIGQKLIIFSPFWFIHSMIDSPDRVGWVKLSLARIAGMETGNFFKLAYSELIGFIIFIIGNLGIRILAFVSLINTKSIYKDNIYLFIFVFSLLSFLIPSLFIQSGNPWNTIQFSYYGLYTTALISGSVAAGLIFKLPKLLSMVILLVFVILTPINSITTASYYIGNPHAKVTAEEMSALDFLLKQDDGTVLTVPFDEKFKNRVDQPWPLFVYDSTAYVSAFSNKASFLEDIAQNQILLTDYETRLSASKDFFLKGDKDFLSKNNISYIYLPVLFNIKLDEKTLGVEKIFENSEVEILKAKIK
ncbi:hypothetical protein A3C59_00675 [Candidatus Daviesbacteria bacterium RIFCSPHIGHO2_02_FULL_36_13]|uniref:Glycosyltransferase RgtA/B/C/D-like domain-containing protein n=1 Tax=Candidatus Daviesbacteria bacterium RIFCSPHIGHO2_02_FULL_36_13 TaxID=1797768 RepID=A0A1F5JPC0_9BACT|nr:MAG: hypothetical protein A3C59_00675 [Candidatus Daviesbacteria bacterium RIFCSPHIGHO2_02_FULL_36_13]